MLIIWIPAQLLCCASPLTCRTFWQNSSLIGRRFVDSTVSVSLQRGGLIHTHSGPRAQLSPRLIYSKCIFIWMHRQRRKLSELCRLCVFQGARICPSKQSSYLVANNCGSPRINCFPKKTVSQNSPCRCTQPQINKLLQTIMLHLHDLNI